MFKGKKWIIIRWDNNGEPYFVSRGRKWYLGDFSHVLFEAEYHGYLTLCNSLSAVIKINDAGENVKLAFIG